MSDTPLFDNDPLRERSGAVQGTCKLEMLLYVLMRDHLPAGKLELIVQETHNPQNKIVTYSNGWLALYAKDLADRLKDNPQSVEESEVPSETQVTRKSEFNSEEREALQRRKSHFAFINDEYIRKAIIEYKDKTQAELNSLLEEHLKGSTGEHSIVAQTRLAYKLKLDQLTICKTLLDCNMSHVVDCARPPTLNDFYRFRSWMQ